MSSVYRSEDLTVLHLDRDWTDTERVVTGLMGEASWTDPVRYFNSIMFGAQCPYALEDLPFMKVYINHALPHEH